MQVHDGAVDNAIVVLVLHAHPVFHSSKVVAQVRHARWLDSRKHSVRWGCTWSAAECSDAARAASHAGGRSQDTWGSLV
jgi:hypothetical protein